MNSMIVPQHLFLPSITYQYKLIDLILLWSFLGCLPYFIYVERKENELDQPQIF